MKQEIFKIVSNRLIAKGMFEMVMQGDTSGITRPGQFINIKLKELYLRRPISISSYKEGELTIAYKVVGVGTRAMAELVPGEELDVLCASGNGFDISKGHGNIALIGGGCGVAPLLGIAEAFVKQRGICPTVLVGFKTKDDTFYKEKFEKLGCKVIVATNDGVMGIQGHVTDAMRPGEYDYAFGCGPLPMLKAVSKLVKDGQFSFESRMACGFGVCYGCSMEMKSGIKRVCTDGPVFELDEINW